MKKLLTILFVLVSVAGYGQTPQFLGGPNNNIIVQAILNVADSPRAVFNLGLTDTATTKLLFPTKLKGRLAWQNGRAYWNRTGLGFGLLDSVSGGGSSIDTTSLSNRINERVKYSDTAAMLAPYASQANLADTSATLRGLIIVSVIDTASLSARINLRVRYADTAGMLLPYAHDSQLSDTAAVLRALYGSITPVTSVAGTTNRITSTGGTTPVIDISSSYAGQTSIVSVGTITTGAWNGTVISPTYGGTGVNNGSNTITTNANITKSGTGTLGLVTTATTSVTLPSSGTLYGTSSGSITSSQLATSLTDETGTGAAYFQGGALGTPSSATLTNGTGLPLSTGVTGVLPVANGGTGLSSVGTSGNVLTSNGTSWVSSAPASGGWGLTGNTITNTDFIGSNNAFPLRFKANGTTAGSIWPDSKYHVFLGTNAGGSPGLGPGIYHVGIGTSAAENISVISQGLTAVGFAAMQQGGDGVYNCAFGYGAGRFNMSGTYQGAYGANADVVAGTGNVNFHCAIFLTNADGAATSSTTPKGRVSIGTTTAHASAVLHVASTTGGVILCSMTTAQRLAITPVEGLEVYDTDLHKKMVYDGTTWQACW